MKDIREKFYDNVGASIKPIVKNKWEAIITGKLGNSETYKGKKSTFICIGDNAVYAVKQLEEIYKTCAMELEDIMIDSCENIIFVKPHWDEIYARPLFKLGIDQKFIPTMKELEKHF